MKRLITSLITLSILFVCLLNVANAAICDLGVEGWVNGTWTVPASCTFPTGPHLINGDAIVGNAILTVPTNSMVVMNLSTTKMTFSLGKTLLSGTAVIKYVRNTFYNTSSGLKSCPAGTYAINPTSLTNAPASLTVNNVGTTGRFYCQ